MAKKVSGTLCLVQKTWSPRKPKGSRHLFCAAGCPNQSREARPILRWRAGWVACRAVLTKSLPRGNPAETSQVVVQLAHRLGTPPPGFHGQAPCGLSQACCWEACHGGQRKAAEYLRARGADLNWIPSWAKQTPLDMAEYSGSKDLAEWLRGQGARPAKELS